MFDVGIGKDFTKNNFKKRLMLDYIYPVYSSQTLNDGIMGFYNDYIFKNSITWAILGKPGFVKYRNHKFFAIISCGVMTHKKQKASEYFAHVIDWFGQYHIETNTIYPCLKPATLREVPITYTPNIQEQQKISKLIQLLDKHIDLKQKQLNKYKNIKQGLIDKMFI